MAKFDFSGISPTSRGFPRPPGVLRKAQNVRLASNQFTLEGTRVKYFITCPLSKKMDENEGKK